jgi:hypothetical protein
VLDAPPSNIDALLSRGTHISTIHLNRPIWNKMSVSHFETPDWKVVFMHRKNVLDDPASKIDGLL